jgi:hypothetical protein
MQRALASIAIVLVLVFGARALSRVDSLSAAPPDTADISAEQRAAGLTFDASVAPGDRAWILAAIAKARPEAQRMIADVDGLTTIRTPAKLAMGVGVTHSRLQGGVASFDIELDLATLNGRRVVDREMVVLHELGHAIDFALVPKEVNAQLDAGIPRTGTCGQDTVGAYGSCTAPAERFADTFAKWALRGSVSAVGAGYGVATPASLEDWGAPLTRLANSLP